MTADSDEWTTGSIVTIGFMRFQIALIRSTPNEDNTYILNALDSKKQYEYNPSKGLKLIKKET